ncbi:g1690 [Coccomyxa viridis]|uniref:G1690 protein n=1 Tax=Coccomyxa viridis TaxID=1274662 RepID=A0ABP1FIK8_9CHLO
MSSSIAKQVAKTAAQSPESADRGCERCNTACQCANNCECGPSCECPHCDGQQTRVAKPNKKEDAELLSKPTNFASTAAPGASKSDAKH